MQRILLFLFLIITFIKVPLFAMEKKKKELVKPLDLSSTQIIQKHKQNSPFYLHKERGKFSPARFQNKDVRQTEEYLQKINEYKRFILLVYGSMISNHEEEETRYRLALNLLGSYKNCVAAADEYIDPKEKSILEKESIDLQNKVYKLTAVCHFHDGQRYLKRARNKNDTALKKVKNSEEQIILFQRAQHYGERAKNFFQASLNVQESDSAKNLHEQTENFLNILKKNIQLLPNYQTALSLSKKAYATERLGRKSQANALAASEKNNDKRINQKYIKHLDDAENAYINAAQQYLAICRNLLSDKIFLLAAHRAIEGAYKAQRDKREEDINAPINPLIGELARKIEEGFKTIEEREESSSSTISTEGSNKYSTKEKK